MKLLPPPQYIDEDSINEGFLGFGQKKPTWKQKLARIAANGVGALAGYGLHRAIYKKRFGKLPYDSKDYFMAGSLMGAGSAIGDKLYQKYSK